MANTRRRVKLYVMNEDRQWDDRGTGYVSSSYVELLQGMALLVRSEEDGKTLLESKIHPHTAYQKQQDTLIVWAEADNYDLALSFQEKVGCDEIWEKICNVQGKDPSVTLTQDIGDDSEFEEKFEDVPDAAAPIDLPPCELSQLADISALFTSVLTSPIRREKLSLEIEQEGYIKQLMELFHMCEDLENTEGLHHLFEIVKTLFLLDKNFLYDTMFGENVIMDTLGCLEYDPTKKEPQRYRRFLKENVRFREVIPINNAELLLKIHQTYQVQYIMDIVLPTPTVFEENMLPSLNAFLIFSKFEIVNMVQEDNKFLEDFFINLCDEETSPERKGQLVQFLKELCSLAQPMQHVSREEFFKALTNHNLLQALEMLLAMDDPTIRSIAVEIFSQLCEVRPSAVREYVLQMSKSQQDDDSMLLNQIIYQMISEGDSGIAIQLSQVIRLLLDPENMALTANMEKTEFLSYFYKHCMHILVAPLLAATADGKVGKLDYNTAVNLALILEISAFCVEHHTYHIKNYVISKDLLRRILVLMKSEHKFLVLSALRCCRRIVGLKDEFYNRYIVKGKLFDAIVDSFKCNENRYNLLNSATVELFEFIRQEDIKTLCSYVCKEYSATFTDIEYVNTFKGLFLRVEQEIDRVRKKEEEASKSNERTPRGIIHVSARFRRDPRALEEEEESWFDQDDDEEQNGGDDVMPSINASVKSPEENFKPCNSFPATNDVLLPSSTNKIIGLVDYPDDEDDEDEDNDDTTTSPAKRPRLGSI
ncbi:serine/threonine-protein phosphatase 4 regulatory subunit 3-like isoform X2 [Dendronephthya gigantea]|uniref:serine/threonine-protein phosphatase 4 regulatory subunit 3-like isoform X2 n=1 Tax=Dendronephthya gigantea TaxID=151771 RepID=UPI00106D327C|nr:serine/threonine-protein phosphatase 4 regulatory subunit 3-like isoform X2 [Dendronephthya gigantea]